MASDDSSQTIYGFPILVFRWGFDCVPMTLGLGISGLDATEFPDGHLIQLARGESGGPGEFDVG